jgi:hypothetical protein
MSQKDMLGAEVRVQLSRERLEYGAVSSLSLSSTYEQCRGMNMRLREVRDAYLVN